MDRITREVIRQLASSDTVYYRGMRYYAAHAVSKVTWNETSKQYRAIVKGGSQYAVTISLDDEIAYSCNCPARVKYTGACKHVIATLLFISDYQMRKQVDDRQEPEEKTAYQILEYFRKREYRRLTPEYYHLELMVNVPEFLKGNAAKSYLGLYAGAGKMYKVANVKKFIQDYYEGVPIRLGKEFSYIPGECDFDEKSKPVMEYLTEIYEVQDTLGKTYYSNLFNRQELVLSKRMLGKVLSFAAGGTCSLKLYGNDFSEVKIIAGNPELEVDLKLQKNALSMQYLGNERLFSLCEDGSILFYKNCLYLPEEDFVCNILPFYSTLLHNEDGVLEFRDENKNDFIEKVLPVIKKSMIVNVPRELKEKYIVEPLNPQIYLDVAKSKTKRYVRATIHFQYGEYEINPLHHSFTGNAILVRDKEEEERLTRILYNLNFKVTDDSFLLKQEEDIFELMTDKMSMLTDNFQVFYSKEYKNSSIRKPGTISGTVRMDTEIDFLEMNLEYAQIPREELEDFFKSLRVKKRYYRLKDGAFIDLMEDSKTLKSLQWIVEHGKLSENGSMYLPKSSVLYLDEILPKNNRLQKDDAYQKLLQELKSPDKVKWDLPEGIRAKLRSYQKTGYQWLKTLSYYGLGGILADDMGLGKTLETILYIASFPNDKSLVVCPTSLVFNWQEEFARFAPGIRTQIVFGTPEERQALLQQEETDVFITTYPLIRKDISVYREIQFDHMFIDEAQFIKNHKSLSAKAVKSVPAKHRFALTGTPIENALSELWSIFEFIMPGFFSPYHKFSEVYEKPIMRGQDTEKMMELKARIKPFILRRMKKQVLKEIPDKTESMRMAQMTKKQEKIYLSYLTRIQTEINDHKGIQSGAERIQILSALTRLRQICCHPGTFVENYHGGSGKLELLLEQLPDLLEADHAVIIFSQFTSMLSIIARALDEEGIGYYYLSGTTKATERKQYVKGFNEGKEKVFLISLKAGGTGLNLTAADTVIHFDPWWNPAVEDQATDRAYRIGQEKQVHVIKYVMKDTIEEKIYQLQKKKKELSDQVIDSGEVFLNQLSQEELRELFL